LSDDFLRLGFAMPALYGCRFLAASVFLQESSRQGEQVSVG